MLVGPVANKLSQPLDIVAVCPLREGENLRHQPRNNYLIDATVRIRGNYCSAGEVYSLAGEVLSEAAMFTFQSLTQGSYGFVSEQVHGKACCFTVEVLGDGPLEHVPVLNQLGCCISSLNCLLDFLVEEDDFAELYSEVVFIFDSLTDCD